MKQIKSFNMEGESPTLRAISHLYRNIIVCWIDLIGPESTCPESTLVAIYYSPHLSLFAQQTFVVKAIKSYFSLLQSPLVFAPI